MGNKRLMGMVLLLGVMISVSGCTGTSQTAAAKDKVTKAEASGFDTPEEALLSYLDFMKAADISGMVSTYAVETYVENYDFEAQLKRLRSYHAMQEVKFPNVNEFAVSINIERRRNSIVNAILNQALVIADFDYDLTMPVMLKEDSDIETFVEDYQESLEGIDFGSIEVLGLAKPADLEEKYDSAMNRKYMNTLATVIGADEMESVVVVFRISSQKYLLCCDAARYGERWYLVNPGGNIGALLGISAWTSGAAPLSRSEFRELEEFIKPVGD